MLSYAERKSTNPEWAERERARLRAKRRRSAAWPLVEADTLTTSDMRVLMDAFGWRRCAYCRATVERDGVTWDHIVPMRAGAGLTPRNAAPCCRPCNSSKSDRELAEWMRAKGYDLDAFRATHGATLVRLGPEVDRPRYNWRATRERPRPRRRPPTTSCRRCPARASRWGLCTTHYARDLHAERLLWEGRTPEWIRVSGKEELIRSGAAHEMPRRTRYEYRKRLGVKAPPRVAVDPTKPMCGACGLKNAKAAGVCMGCYLRRRSEGIAAGTWAGRPR